MITRKVVYLSLLFSIIVFFQSYGQALLPDNIQESDCWVLPEAQNWNIQKVQQVGTVATTSAFVVGDLNEDGFPDIVAYGSNARTSVKIFWGPAFTDITELSNLGTGASSTLAIAKVKTGEDPLPVYESFIFFNTGTILKAIRPDGTSPWSVNPGCRNAGMTGFADFNRDGWTEVYVANQIYDAATGKMLCDGGTGYNSGTTALVTSNISQTIAIDILGDTDMELVAANQIFDVDIDRSVSTAKPLTLISSVTPPAGCPDDGVTVVADFDNDDQLEVLVRRRNVNTSNSTTTIYLYLWTPHTGSAGGLLLASATDTHRYFGVPFVGDIDGDGAVEIVTLGSNGTYVVQNGFRARKYRNGALELFWDINHIDQSGGTGMTLFDFNLDGVSEIVYRDENELRILNGSLKSPVTGADTTVYTLNSFTSYSETYLEYPIVADIYGNQSSAILVTSDIRGPRPSGYAGNANIDIFTSDPSSPWAPSRPVWNQYAYNPLVVNRDLTIPAEQFKMTTVFEGKDSIPGTPDDYRPYNNFLQQAPIFNQYGAVVMLAPDYFIYPDPAYTYFYSGDSLIVHLSVGNQGDAAITPLNISAYRNEQAAANLIGTNLYNYAPAVGGVTPYDLVLHDVTPDDFSQIVLAVNDNGSAVAETPECDTTNNRMTTWVSELVIARNDTVRTVSGYPVSVNVLTNDQYDCDDPALTILTPPLEGSASLNGNAIVYDPGTSFTGTTYLEYRIGCDVHSSVARVVILVEETPDNIVFADCTGDPEASPWSIKELFTYSGFNFSQYVSPLVGDLDGDGVSEIVVARATNGQYFSNTLQIFKGNQLDSVWTLSVKEIEVGTGILAMARIRNIPLIFVYVISEDKVYAYNPVTKENVWTTSLPVMGKIYAGGGSSIGLTDFDGDGQPELYLGNKIYDAFTGQLLWSGSGNSGTQSFTDFNSAGFGAVSFASNMFGDERPELVAGNQIYDVVIDRVTPRLNQASVRQVKPPVLSNSYQVPDDGFTQVADLNNDGKLEVIVSLHFYNYNRSIIYVWDVENNVILAKKEITPNAGFMNYPFIGDINGDGVAEIVVVYEVATTSTTLGGSMQAFRYAEGSTELEAVWASPFPIQESYARTGITLFDFNQDGINEIVYRDMTQLRIINGSGIHHITGAPAAPYNLAAFNCYSGTGYEYPVVADVNGDTYAEIVTIGGLVDNKTGAVRIFSSQNGTWAPARPVWNQYAYNAVHVNEDLTIARYPMNPATLFPNGKRPFNAFLQQQTLLGSKGDPIYLLPDLYLYRAASTYFYDGDSTVVTVSMNNTGDAGMQAPVSISAYKNDVAPENRMATSTFNENINAGDDREFSFTIRNFSSYMDLNRLIIRANDDGNARFLQLECDTTNNEQVIGIYSGGYDDYYGAYHDGTMATGTFGILGNDQVVTTEGTVQMNRIVAYESSAGATLSVVNGAVESLAYQMPLNFTGIDTVRYQSEGTAPDGHPVVVLATAYVYVYSNQLRECYDPSGNHPSIRIDDTEYNVSVDWTYHASDTHGMPEGADANILNPVVTSGPDHYLLNAEVLFHVAAMDTIPAFNNDVYTPFTLEIVPLRMYWNRTAQNNNWNDPANWTDASGSILNSVPMTCTSVYIPGDADHYPSLDSTLTLRTVYYGEPECDSIVYHFGAEVARPNYLSYNKAFVRYNFGYYDSGYGNLLNGDDYPAAPMARDRWYALSAPLQGIVTGDFSFGGFPNTWQRGFKTSRDRNGDLTGEWYVPENTIAMEIGARQNYAISLYFPSYVSSTLGEDDHTLLDNLKGIVELPYFENAALSDAHRIHSYDTVTHLSRFYYYYYTIPGLPVETGQYDEYERADKAYRYVFENASQQAQMPFGIRIPVSDGDEDGEPDEVMLGNPFVSSLDFEKWYSLNSSLIEDYYLLYENGSFNVYPLGSHPPLIAPMQAFFVKPKATPLAEVELSFPEEVSVVRTGSHQLRSSDPDAVINNVLKVGVSNSSGSSWMLLSQNREIGGDVIRMFSEDKPSVPQIYSLDNDGSKQSVRYLDGDKTDVHLGIRTDSKGSFELRFENTADFYAESLILWDRELNEVRNLFLDDRYVFENISGNIENRFTLLIGKQYVPSGMEEDRNTETKIYAVGKRLCIDSGRELEAVQVSDPQGLRVWMEPVSGVYSYRKELPVPPGVYIVSVRLADGETKTEKVVLKE